MIFLELFLYMFFEIDIIVFSKDIEKLSILLHLLALLDFPFNEINNIHLIHNAQFLYQQNSKINSSSFGLYGVQFQYKEENCDTWKITSNSHDIQNIQDKDKQNYQIIIDFLAQCLKIDFKNNRKYSIYLIYL